MKAYQERIFGSVDEQEVRAYLFENRAGYRLQVMTYGATVLEYATPDKEGRIANIILGFDNLEAYIGNSPKHGASIGPVAGRIAGAQFELNGVSYILEKNAGPNCNHSGSTGWDATVFQVEEVTDQGITFYTERVDGTGGFPGNLKIWISYRLSEAGALEISYRVTSDQDTLVNPTNHSYFNLTGDVHQTIDSHLLQLETSGVFPIAEDGVPAKEADASPTFVVDLQKGVRLSDLFASADPQIRLVDGLDHPFALWKDQEIAGSLYEANSGRYLTFKTQAPVAVVYTANVCDPAVQFDGQSMHQHNGIALELQALPDAIHGSQATQVILPAGQTFSQQTIYRASVKEVDV
ncbi:aldose epimerase family protein [Streptococcus danieliae]|uniref:aldose epimerase family protein n=1 Tax=Streptococcus danieliae TaxID=747656 RepID=UPI0026E959E6|nr:aldose epimerase family protein [Streptococcus danieliae]